MGSMPRESFPTHILIQIFTTHIPPCCRCKRYKEKLKQWGLDKNLTRKQSRFIQRKTLQRRKEGKQTEFLIGKSLVPQEKIERHLKTKETTFDSPTGSKFHRPVFAFLSKRSSLTLGSHLPDS